jgi:hypothetical protein
VALEQKQITPFQYMCSAICFIQSSALLSTFFAPVVHQDAWMVGLFGLLAAMPLLLVYMGIMKSLSFETLRMANIGVLNRMEVLFVIVLILLLFFKIMFLYYVTVMASAQLIGMKSSNPLVLMMGALVVVYSVFVYPDTQTHAISGPEIVPILWLLFEFLLPALTLAVGRIRGLHKTPPQKETVLT